MILGLEGCVVNALCDMSTGQRARVVGVPGNGAMSRRLLDVGFTPGAAVTCLFQAPCGDPRAYLVRGTVIALRNADAAGVELLPGAAQPGDAARRGDGAWD